MSKQDTDMDRPLRALILTDGKMGDLAQCRGVATALGAKTDEIVVMPSPAAAFFKAMRADRAFHDQLASLEQAPDIVLASGRRAVPYLKATKAKWGEQSLSVFLKDPRTGAKTADLIWVPAHDRLRGDTVLATDTGPHGHTLARQQQAASQLEARLTSHSFPRPWLGVLLGGATKKVPYEEASIAACLNALKSASAKAGAVLITPSRRTPEALIEAVRSAHPHVWVWDGAGENPYPGMLGACDAFLVTGDSHNMVSEALSTGRQVMVFRPAGLPAKFARFLDHMTDIGTITPPQEPDFSHRQEPLDATPVIASRIRETLTARNKAR
jgi:hypothetical protein